MVRKQNTVPLLKRYWVSSIGVFLLSQIFFIISEATGWKLNYRDTHGTILGRILDTPIFAEWFNFYETPHYNLLTVFFGVFFLVPGMISAIKNGFSR
ncbi:YfzA family protein [Paenibacillus sp. alder61]|uniref:YfzA family protein n=1 Tax=Paenibacillus sp. alder61 TaxID=2862948 RepID=UPI001CD289E4|nr:YfzA family protein [Paenibacillus sp. alder61]MCA1295176.1 YfzA family protein [Paenibacillus sp. alder61]